MSDLIFSAYNASAGDLESNPVNEDAWYDKLKAETVILGLGLRFNNGLHPAGVGRLARVLDPQWRSIVSTVPQVLSSTVKDPQYGLASEATQSREQAVADVRALLGEIRALQDLLGEQAVFAVEVQSAPKALSGASSQARLIDSLSEIASWDWHGIQLSLEHCDALLPETEAQKGFLRIEEEIEAVATVRERTGFAYGQSVNWGRSAIESRSTEGPVDHLSALIAAGTLCGLIFSGASGANSTYGTPWKDGHAPIDEAEPTSLLSREQIRRCLDLVSDTSLSFLGAKVGAPSTASTQEDRLRAALATLHAVAEEADR